MKTNVEITKKSVNGMETKFDYFEMYVLNEKEMDEINGGAHYEIVDGQLTWVRD